MKIEVHCNSNRCDCSFIMDTNLIKDFNMDSNKRMIFDLKNIVKCKKCGRAHRSILYAGKKYKMQWVRKGDIRLQVKFGLS